MKNIFYIFIFICSFVIGQDYYFDAVNGSDVTGNGTSGNPYQTMTKGLKVLPDLLGFTDVNFYLDSGDYDIDTSFIKEFQKKELLYCTFSIIGNSWQTIEDGLTFIYNASQGFYSYDASKTGLTVIADQYKNKWVEKTSGLEFYPIASNTSGTDNFDIEYLRDSRAQPTRITDFNANLYSSDYPEDYLQFEPKSSIYSKIFISRVNIKSSESLIIETGRMWKQFRYCKLMCRALGLNSNSINRNITVSFDECQLEMSSSKDYAIYLGKGDGYDVRFRRFFLDASKTNNAAISSKFTSEVQIVGMYILGDDNTGIEFINSGSTLVYAKPMKFKDFDVVFDAMSANFYPNIELPLVELENCTYLFNESPKYKSYFYIDDINGSFTNVKTGVYDSINIIKQVFLDINK